MPLYTLITDYKGGTYIAQETAENIQAAVRNWANGPSITNIQGLKEKHIKQIKNELYENMPVAISGTKNVWCTGFRASKNLAILHIVQTADI